MNLKDKEKAVTLLKRALAGERFDDVLSVLDNFVSAAGNVAELAREVGVNRVHLYRMFKAGAHPRFDAVIKLLKANGINLRPVLAESRARAD